MATKMEMAEAIVKALYNTPEIRNDYLKRQCKAYTRWKVADLATPYKQALRILAEREAKQNGTIIR